MAQPAHAGHELMHQHALDWIDPLELAVRHSHEESLCLFHSGLKNAYTGGQSILAINAEEIIETDNWETLEAVFSSEKECYEHFWCGHLSYEMYRNDIETPDTSTSPTSLPISRFTRYRDIYVWDHATRTLTLHSPNETVALPDATQIKACAPTVAAEESNFTYERYLGSIERTVEEIHAGNFYQANITRKVWGEIEQNINCFGVYVWLHKHNPAPYSAYIKHRDTAILSSSPECFLTCDSAGKLITRPIKGSSKPNLDVLGKSTKDKAENLMIVDLMRNDLSRVCEPSSIHVDALHEIEQYEHIAHLVSTISGQKHTEATTLDSVRACFPPGSMTGAPKIAAMEWIAEQERMDRGVYSGAIGWFGGDGSCDLSVVIRTLVMQGNRIEYQSGGGIVADSQPENEWQELELKRSSFIT